MTTPVVLDEETYTEALSNIIERDFFPHLAKVKAQQNYLQAQQSGTLLDLERASKALQRAQTPLNRQQTPFKGSRSATSSNDSSAITKSTLNYYNAEAIELTDRVNLDLSLDQFQTLYTSEDNASFTEILERTNAKRREKYKWLLDKEKAPMITAEEKKLIEYATTPATWKYTAKNALMYMPAGTGESLLNEADSRAPAKAINYNNTQFAIPELPASRSQTNRATDGQATPWKNVCGVDDDGESIYSDANPNYRGYRLVDATPTLSPSRIGSPLMTWGNIEGTPMLISGSETPGPQFSLPKESKREKLGMKLSEKASRAHRKRMNERMGTPRKGVGLASPAAQHLLRRSHTPRTSAFGDALRSSYGGNTPRGSRTPGATPTPLFRAGATPHSRFQTPAKKKN
ncbi:nuclear protein DGCR14 [Phascolomyces articulosus]|uniref:Nuclear protein DGCR14 n=1 Tax=Phascolomyces articulosus TaxID=60185 RepID=A0AAD5PAM4_9FUNG|nr:nuclear protein DGCR14 [Phascolomyces articulosus]